MTAGTSAKSFYLYSGRDRFLADAGTTYAFVKMRLSTLASLICYGQSVKINVKGPYQFNLKESTAVQF